MGCFSWFCVDNIGLVLSICAKGLVCVGMIEKYKLRIMYKGLT